MPIGTTSGARRPDWNDVLGRAERLQRRRAASRRTFAAIAGFFATAAIVATPVFGLSQLRSLLGLTAQSPGLRLSATLAGAGEARGSLTLVAPHVFVAGSGRPFAPVARAHSLVLRWRLAASGLPPGSRLRIGVEGAVTLSLCRSCRPESGGQQAVSLALLSRLARGQTRAVVVTAHVSLSGPIKLARSRTP
ncbi:MAG: hypothetical protein ACJ743_07665 [Gaiellaceae bacterium]